MQYLHVIRVLYIYTHNVIQQESPAAETRGWTLERIICKSNDDLRQEVFIMQLISFYLEVFQKEKLDLWVQPYRILSTSKTTGLIQVCNYVAYNIIV